MINRVLVIGAHYDDAELGAGALMARLSHEGVPVYKITLTNTEVHSTEMDLNIASQDAKSESARSAKILGIKELSFPTAKYGKLEYSQETMHRLENLINELGIDTCIFHYGEDYNTDHIAAHRICLTAARHCKNLLMFQSNPYLVSGGFSPNVFFDVTDFIELKREALACYDAQHNRQGKLFETNIERNRVYGYGVHAEFAEGFVAIKMTL